MALKFRVPKIEDVEEAFRPLYKPTSDGKAFQLDAEGAEAAEDVLGLKNALASEKETAKERAARLKAIEDGDLKELARLKEEERKRKEKAATESGDFESLKAQLLAQHGEEMAKKDALLSTRDKQLEKVTVQRDALDALVAAQVISPKVMLPHVMPFLKMVEENGDLVTRVVDEKGTIRIGDAKGTPMTIGQLIETMKTVSDYQPFFKGTGGRGSGSDSDSGKGGGGGDKPASKMSPDEKRAFIDEQGMDAWRAKVNAENS